MKRIMLLNNLAEITAGPDRVLFITHIDGSFWRSQRVQIIDGIVYASPFMDSVIDHEI
ncbi:hypothetical protein MUGA111182_05885 [Mucilaginibacter galii]|uniref:Uncharacterized protein n=1 Tax=Mucilaginibacter galii TaxID=2005073 RepID=A0A917J6C8_9SPHI|nr:hypothetical protein GCM10011425_12020 [Mucilaginibacter galii]